MKIGPLLIPYEFRRNSASSVIEAGGYRTSPVVVHRLLVEEGQVIIGRRDVRIMKGSSEKPVPVDKSRMRF